MENIQVLSPWYCSKHSQLHYISETGLLFVSLKVIYMQGGTWLYKVEPQLYRWFEKHMYANKTTNNFDGTNKF